MGGPLRSTSPTPTRSSARLAALKCKQEVTTAPRTPPQQEKKRRLRLLRKATPKAVPRPSTATQVPGDSSKWTSLSQWAEVGSVHLKRNQDGIVASGGPGVLPQIGMVSPSAANFTNAMDLALQDDLAEVASTRPDEPFFQEEALVPEHSVQTAPSSPQNMPGGQFHLDLARGRRAPQVRQHTHRGHGHKSDSTWCCSVLRRMSFGSNPTCQKAWQHWATCAQDIASRHVRNKFNTHLGPLLLRAAAASGAGRRSGGELETVLALAGSDCADHEATASLMQSLVVAEMPASRIARVTSEDFSSLPVVSRCIASQLLCRSQVAHGRPEEAGAMDFVDAYKQESPSSQGLVVLIIERADAVPKDILRSALNSWGCACCDHSVPMMVIMTLQYPPQSRQELLEGDTLVPLRFMDAISLFDARTVCSELLECLMEDPQSPLPLAPQLFAWLWDLFTQKCPSVDHTLKALALLCLRLHEAGGPLAPVAAGQESAARDVASWWQRMCQSMGPVDALVCSTHALAAHESRVKRKCKFLATLCPQAQDDSNENGTPNTAVNLENLMSGLILKRSLKAVEQWPPERVLQLQQDLCATNIKLDGPLQKQLQLLGRPGLDAETLRQKILRWFEQLQARLWQPLVGESRSLFVASLAQADSATRDVEQQLACGTNVAASACFLPLAECGARAEADDSTLLYRVLEHASGRSIAVADLWRIFSQHAPTGGDASRSHQKRFGLALVALNSLGYIIPLTGGRQFEEEGMPGAAYGGRRVRKRHYGRLRMLRRYWAKECDNDSTDPVRTVDNSEAVSLALANVAEGNTSVGTTCSSSQQQVTDLVPQTVHEASAAAPTFGHHRYASQSMPQEPASFSAQKRRFAMSPAHGQKRRGAVNEGKKRPRFFMG